MYSKKAIKAIFFFCSFSLITYFLIKDEYENYKKTNALYSYGINTTASLLEYKVVERRGRLGLKYDSYAFIYEYYDQHNMQHKYKVNHGALQFQQQLDESVIDIVYNPNHPSSAVEAKNLEPIGGIELLFNFLSIILLALFCPFITLLLLNEVSKKPRYEKNTT